MQEGIPLPRIYSKSRITAGQFWVDTTNHILKLRNEADSAWLEIWDLANDIPMGQDFTDGSYLDGDKIDIDWNPSNYTPDSSPAEASDADDLSAHLKGIDDEISTINTAIGAVVLPMAMPFHSGDTEEDLSRTGDGWKDIDETKFRIYLPSSVETLTLAIYGKKDSGNNCHFCFNIDGNNSGNTGTLATSYSWVTCTYDCSALSGWVDFYIRSYHAEASQHVYYKRYSTMWS